MLIYLASPYSHDDPVMRQRRYEAALRAAAWLMMRGFHVYSPIVHSHPIAVHFALPTDFDYWRGECELMLSKCDAFVLLDIEGANASRGVAAETEIAIARGIPMDKIFPYGASYVVKPGSVVQNKREQYT